MNRQELDRLIERYFNAETSLDEERRLRRMLASPEADTPEADEARAVLGIFAAQRHHARRTSGPSKAATWRAAAGIALLLAAGAVLFTTGNNPENDCYVAYSNGTISHETSDALAAMHADLNAMADASMSVNASIADDFSSILNILNNPQ